MYNKIKTTAKKTYPIKQVWSLLQKWNHGDKIIYNVNRESNVRNKKRALLSYLTYPFLMESNSPEFYHHQNKWCNIAIAKILGELGYIVDVIDWTDFQSKISHKYNLLIGFGRAEELAKEMPSDTLKIRLSTGSEAYFANRRETQRLAEIEAKRGCKIGNVRQSPDRAEYLKYFDGIACLGNEAIAGTYRPYFDKKILCWDNHGFDRFSSIPDQKNFNLARNNFLFLSGSGFVLVGLDLVLEVFSNLPELNLFVCGNFAAENDFIQCYEKELFRTPNIFPIGWTQYGGYQYNWLMRKCSTIIFPICAGASPGSVTAAMGFGIIPMVAKEAGIDTEDYGFTLTHNDSKTLSDTVKWISSQSEEWHKQMSQRVYAVYQAKYSQQAFLRRFKEILVEFINSK
ncbi:MAG: hypothetical protein ABR954_10265 [Dehalococcoidales bacterium]|jgi:glycosyltransferase involved in cell wall biosynthesis